MKYTVTILLILVLSNYYTQCTLNLISSVDSVLCGEEVTLSAFGSMDGNVAFEEDFSSGSPQGWQFTQSVTVANNTCGVPSPDGSDFMWMGDAAVNPRDMTTVSLDLSLGGVICFEMRYAEQGDASPCEGPDESDEGVALRYSIDNGATWVDIEYWDPNGGNDPTLTAWNQYCVTLPPGAMTGSTLIQWHQDAVSGPEFDHWGIDNVQITLNEPNSQISWQHDGYNYPLGSSGGENPNSIPLTTETSFTATITNGTNTCTETITVPVRLPVIEVNAGLDEDICPGDCVTLSGEAKVIKSPAKTPTYENAESDVIIGNPAIPFISPVGDFSSQMNLQIAGLNQNSISNGSITSICITGFNITALGGSSSLAEAEIILTCPNGNTINLVNAGELTGNDITNMCFQTGAPAISSGSAPYTGSFSPSQPISGLNGCDANGLWNITIQGDNYDPSLPIGGVEGWSITFDDPEISYEAPFTWSPTTNMTNELTLSPTVCPTTDFTYTLTASDSNACTTASDDINITISNSCCDFDISSITNTPSCGNTDGNIDLTITNGSGNYTFDWGANGTTEDLTAIPQGIYTVTITDVTDGCSKDTTFDFSSNAFNYTLNLTPPSCGSSDGAIEFVPNGGTAPFEYSIDNGATFLPTTSFNNLTEGTYNLAIQDAASCRKDTVINFTGSSYNYSLTLTPPLCGASNGSIVFSTTGSAGPFGFSIDNGVTVSADSNFTGLSSGTYNLLISDVSGCIKDSIITLGNAGSLSGTVNIVDLVCNGDNNGRIILTAVGGNAPYTYDIGNGPQNTTVFNSLSAGSYNITIADNAGCTFDTIVTVQQPPAININLNIVDPTCYNTCDASVEASVTGGTIANDPLYSWSGILSSNTGNSVSNICINNYTLTITDDNGCEKDTLITFVAPADLISDFSASPQPTTIFNPDVTLTEESTNGVTFNWYVDSILVGNGSNYVHTYPSDSAGSYNTCLVIEDVLGCSDSICKKVIINSDFILFLPNTFTPDGDGDNDYFFPQGLGLNLVDYEFLIFDRWGELIWESASSTDQWDGNHKGKGCQDGVYLWKFATLDQGNKNIQRMGHVTLMR